MYVRFWGTRGSIASPGEGTVRYGGNTSCVELRAGDGTVIVLDCGTGARDLGLHLVRTMPSPLRLHLFIGHTTGITSRAFRSSFQLSSPAPS